MGFVIASNKISFLHQKTLNFTSRVLDRPWQLKFRHAGLPRQGIQAGWNGNMGWQPVIGFSLILVPDFPTNSSE
jgi:hypothetical protein